MATNKYAGICEKCSAEVQAGAGTIRKSDSGRWLVSHAACPANPQPVLLNSPAPPQPAPLDPAASAAKHGRTAVAGAAVRAFESELNVCGKRAVAEAAVPKDGTVRKIKGKRYVQIDHARPRFFSADDREDFDQFDRPAGWEYSWSGVEVEPNATEQAADAKVSEEKRISEEKRATEKRVAEEKRAEYDATRSRLIAERALLKTSIRPKVEAVDRVLVAEGSRRLEDWGACLHESLSGYDDWRDYYYVTPEQFAAGVARWSAEHEIDAARAADWLEKYRGCEMTEEYEHVAGKIEVRS